MKLLARQATLYLQESSAKGLVDAVRMVVVVVVVVVVVAGVVAAVVVVIVVVVVVVVRCTSKSMISKSSFSEMSGEVVKLVFSGCADSSTFTYSHMLTRKGCPGRLQPRGSEIP